MLLTILPPAAAAQPVRDPAVDQYVESVPGPDGDGRAPGEGRHSGGGGLSPDVQRQLEAGGGEDADALRALASSPALGAQEKADRRARAEVRAHSESDPSAFSAIASAAGGDGNSGGWLLAGLATLTVALAVLALVRRRSLSR